MKPFYYIMSCILFDTTYALYGMHCLRYGIPFDKLCNETNMECIAGTGRCGCLSHTQVHWGLDLKVECNVRHADRCYWDRDCGGIHSNRICNKNNICECSPDFIYIGSSQCYKTDKPNGASFLKDCDHRSRNVLDKDKIVRICHPEDNVFCSTSGKCICFPGFFGDRNTKLCRPKSEYIQDKKLNQYKVKPRMFCHSDRDCIDGLECSDYFCRCPDGCVYKSYIESCDCGRFYESDEYWDQSHVMPSIVGTFLGLIITCGWCIPIRANIDKINGGGDKENNEDEQALNPQPRQVNHPVSVPIEEFHHVQNTGSPQPLTQASFPPYPVGTSSLTGGATNYPPCTPAVSPAPGTLSHCLEHGEKTNPPNINASPSDTNIQPYGPQSYNLHPSVPMYVPSSYTDPPPSYSEALAQDARHAQPSNEEATASSLPVKQSPFK